MLSKYRASPEQWVKSFFYGINSLLLVLNYNVKCGEYNNTQIVGLEKYSWIEAFFKDSSCILFYEQNVFVTLEFHIYQTLSSLFKKKFYEHPFIGLVLKEPEAQ